ncbi:MAG: hypothetical protein GX197_03310, partial [Firmicutes bacterium]|nr:hypothetical protein [Bacillota bacterium]
LEDAQETALAMADNLDSVMKGYGAGKDKKVSKSKGLGPIKLFGEVSKDGFKVGIGQNLIGFADGFKAGVNLYFAMAEPPSDESEGDESEDEESEE